MLVILIYLIFSFLFLFLFLFYFIFVSFFKYFYSNFSAWVPRFTYVVKFLLLSEDLSILILNFCYSRYPGEQEEWTMIAAMSVYSRLVIFFLYYHFQSQFFVRGYQFSYILILSSLFIIVLFTSISVYRCWPNWANLRHRLQRQGTPKLLAENAGHKGR